MIYLVTFGILLFPLSLPGVPTLFNKQIKPILALIIPFFIFFLLVILATWIGFPINDRFWTLPMKIISYSAIIYTGISLPISIKFWMKNKHFLSYIIIVLLLLFVSRCLWHNSLVYADTWQYGIIEQLSNNGQKPLPPDFINYYLFEGIYQFIGVFSSIIKYNPVQMHVVFSLVFISIIISIFVIYAIEEIMINRYATIFFLLLFFLTPSELVMYLGTSFTLFFFFGVLFVLLLLKKSYDKTDSWLYILLMAFTCTFSGSFVIYMLFYFFFAIKVQCNIMTIFLSIITIQYGIIISWEFALFSLVFLLYPLFIRTTLISEAIKVVGTKIKGIIFAALMSFLLMVIFTIFLIFTLRTHPLIPNGFHLYNSKNWIMTIFGSNYFDQISYFNLVSYFIIILMSPLVFYIIFRNRKIDLIIAIFTLISITLGYSFYIQTNISPTNYNIFLYRFLYSLPLLQPQIIFCTLFTFLIFKIKKEWIKFLSWYKYLLPITPVIIISPAFSQSIHYFDTNNKEENEITKAVTTKTLFITSNEVLLSSIFAKENSVVPIYYRKDIYDIFFATLNQENTDPNYVKNSWIPLLDKSKVAIDSNTNYDLKNINLNILPGIILYYSTNMYLNYLEYKKDFDSFIYNNIDRIVMENSNDSNIKIDLFNKQIVKNTIGVVYGK